MSGRPDSETYTERPTEAPGNGTPGTGTSGDEAPGSEASGDEAPGAGPYDDAEGQPVPEARRARWVATATGSLLTAAGLAAAPLIPLAYASGAAVCALAAVLGSRGRTRRALWLMIAGTALMAVGDQFD
jgi:hypothetical protein